VSKRKQKFHIGQVVSLIGYDSMDPRRFVIIVREIEPDEWEVNAELAGKVEARVYPSGLLKQLTARERGR
jgi:hypothetical protein